MNAEYNQGAIAEEEYQDNNDLIQEEQFENDDQYMLELQRRVAMMKNERKEAEKDSQLLFNRLRLLKGEEEKTWKKISETKKKTNEKLNNLEKMHENIRIKQGIREKREREIEMQKQINLERKFSLKNKIEQKKEEKIRQLNEEFKLLKIQKEYNKELKNYIIAEEQNLNKTKCENIRNQTSVLDEKKKAYEIEKRNQNRIELEKRLLEEYRLKEDASQKMVELENQEMEILKRIRTTTQVHKNSINNILNFLVCEQLEKLSMQDLDNVNHQSLNNSSLLNKSQSLHSLNKNNSFLRK